MKCLQECDGENNSSIAIPVLGMITKGYPAEVIAASIIEGIKEYSIGHATSSIKNVKLYIDDKETTASHQKVFY